MEQRRGFYSWFQSETDSRGFETRWAGAAARTVGKLEMLLWKSSDVLGYSNSEIRGFVQSGNKLILDDVWGSLQGLYNGQPLVGAAAQSWDSKQLYQEQILINDLYWGLSNKSLTTLENSIKQNYILSRFTTDPRFKGSILNTHDRYKFGMKLMGIKMFYKINLIVSVVLFLLTMTVRNRLLYAMTDNVKLAQNILSVWNAVMLLGLSILLIQSIWLATKLGGRYYFFGGLALVMLLVTVIGIFLTPRGTI
ncbi:hypothetical protein ACFOET_11160 [Parapedobacter deserti]|uniref:Uncharacterized protein n=1 Tax=Parapedobacter deserti TaxID=1912957 RepID=A0ABV7JJD6_9SPHI